MTSKVYWVTYQETRILSQRIEVREGEDPEAIAREVVAADYSHHREVLCAIGPGFTREMFKVEPGDEKDQELLKHR